MRFIFYQDAFIARNLGREPLLRLLGMQAIKRIEGLNQNQLEGNFFLITELLMTGFLIFLDILGIGDRR